MVILTRFAPKSALVLAILLPVVLSAVFAFRTPHKFYFSHSSIDLSDQKQNIEWSVKIFYDDLELALSQKHQRKISFYAQNQSELLPLVAEYLQERTALVADQAELKGTFIGYELQGDLVICYTEYAVALPIHALTIKNAILLSECSGQKNVIQVSYNGSAQTLLCNASNERAQVFY